MRSLTYFLTSIFLVTLRIQNFLIVQFWSLSDLVSEYRVRFDRSIKKYFHLRSKSIKKWHLISQFQTFFFEKNFLLEIVWFVKITDFFFRFAKIFQFFVVAPHQQLFEIFEKVEFLQGHEELNIGNGTVIFRERPSFQKANNFLNLT